MVKYSKNGFDEIREALGIEETTEERILSNIYYRISSDLIRYRIENNLTQQDLSKKLNVSQSIISQYESGVKQLSMKRIVQIYCDLDLDITNLFSEYALYALEHSTGIFESKPRPKFSSTGRQHNVVHDASSLKAVAVNWGINNLTHEDLLYE